jgi:TolB-like protein
VPSSVSSPKIIRFGDYEVDVPAGHLRKCGVKVKLRDQSFEMLVILLEHKGEVVTREDLRRRLWSKDVFVDFDDGLNTAIARLREALGDSAEHPRFIETLPKRGYRFIASVSEPATRRPRLVVLPFANLSGDPALEYLSDAMTEEIITELANMAPESLAVIARTTAMYYKHSEKDIAGIGGELAVDYVVEGSVQRGEGRIGINVQLIEVKDQTHLWANRYDAGWRDILSIARAVAEEIAAHTGFTPRRSTRKTTEDPEAYNLYIQGRYQMFQMSPAGMSKAKQCFEEAIARDRKFALAYDALAELYWYLGFLGSMPPRESSSTGVLAAMRALELDDTLAETHALLGWYRKELDYDWPEVHREMSRALELNPASPVVRFRYAKGWLVPHGRMEEAVAEIEGALESDPLSKDMRHWLGIVLWLGREYDRAIEEARRLLELDPAYMPAYFGMGLYCREKRLFDEAIRAHRRAAELSGGAPVTLGVLGLTLAQSGNTAEARALLERLHGIALKAYVPPTSFAWIHLGLGDIDDAFTWMDRAIDARDHMMTPIKTYPFLDSIRRDPRYLELLRKMNLTP